MDSQRKTLVDILLDPSVEAKELPFSLLDDITAHFSVEIGRGGFGVVYKGVLPNEMVVAVKRLQVHGQVVDDVGFHREVDSMKKLSHKNVVRLLGYCLHTETEERTIRGQKILLDIRRERLLCCEFVPNGPVPKANLSNGSHDPSWPTIYQTIKGICSGLDYIHGQGYLHLDLKPDNILLGENMVPKITDFGLSRFFGDQSTRYTNNTPGTWGYMAPEYIDDKSYSKKTDIFSLGAVIFELLTGSKGPVCYQNTEEKSAFLHKKLHSWNYILLEQYSGRKLELAYQQVETCFKIALKCKDVDKNCRSLTPEIFNIIDLALDPDILNAQFVGDSVVSFKDFDSPEDMDMHPILPWILSSLSSGCIEIRNYADKKCQWKFQLSDKPVHSAKFGEGEGWNIVAGDDLGVLHVRSFEWSQKESKFVLDEVETITATGGMGITSLAVHPSNHYVLLSTGSSIMIWNTKDWTCTWMHDGPSFPTTVKHACFNNNNDKEFSTGCFYGTVKLWRHGSVTSTERPYLVLRGHSEQVCSISSFTCDSEMFVVTGSMDKTAKVWRYNAKHKNVGFQLAKPEATLKHAGGVTAICYIQKFNIILTGTNNGVVTAWCSKNYRQKRLLCFGLGRICNLTLTLGRRLFIIHEHGVVLVEIHASKL